MGLLYNEARSQLLNQFSGSEIILGILEALFDRLENSQVLIEYLRDNLNLDDAEGVWLNIIGIILGLERPLAEQDPGTIFTTKDLGDPDDPFKACYDPATGFGGYIQSYDGLTNLSDPSALENDTNYRKLLRAKTFAVNQIGIFSDVFTYIKDGFDVRSQLESPQTGLIQITLDDFLSQRERRHVENFGPLLAGVAIEFLNWPTAP